MTMTPEPSPSTDTPRESFSLIPLLNVLWDYRRPAALTIGLILGIYVIFALIMTLRVPVERVASIGFRLQFDGAENSEYPNGDPFSVSDITARAVLAQVHEANQLGRYLTVDELKAALVVTQSSPELIILTKAYESRLANPSLNQVARAEIETEFRERRAALRVPELAISYVRATRIQSIPDDLLQKVLLNILETWSNFSRDRRGVQAYAIEVFSGEFADREFRGDTAPAIKIDMLRRRVDTLIQQSNILAEIPGAHAVAASSTKQTIGEIRAHLEDLKGFELQLALASALNASNPRETPEVELYLRTRLEEVDRRLIQQRNRLARFEETLRLFSVDTIPALAGANKPQRTTQGPVENQLEESFLTTLLATVRRQEDFEYRRSLANRVFETGNIVADLESEKAYYQVALDNLRRSIGRVGGMASAAYMDDIASKLRANLNAQYEIYQQISALHLDRGDLYRVVVGYHSQTQRGVLENNLLYGGISVFLLSLILVPLACIVHHTWWARRRQPI